MKARAVRLPGQEFRLFRLIVELDVTEQDLVRTAPPIAFRIPQLPGSSIHADADHRIAGMVDGKVELMGVLDPDRGWFGNCSTVDPAEIPAIERAIEAQVSLALDMMRALSILARGPIDPKTCDVSLVSWR